MSKAVLVMDMQKDCCDCRFCRELEEGVKACCEIMDNPCNSDLCRIIDVQYCMEKPDWCPLRELPNPKEKGKAENVLEIFTNAGYNACIDELLGEEHGKNSK